MKYAAGYLESLISVDLVTSQSAAEVRCPLSSLGPVEQLGYPFKSVLGKIPERSGICLQFSF